MTKPHSSQHCASNAWEAHGCSSSNDTLWRSGAHGTHAMHTRRRAARTLQQRFELMASPV